MILVEIDGRVFKIGKTHKGTMRDHRKGKCTGICAHCFDEMLYGARFEHVRYK